MEVTQFTYFQEVAGLPLDPVSVEITYGLERLAMYLQGISNVFDLRYNDRVTYGRIFQENERQQSIFNFEKADRAVVREQFDFWEREAAALLEDGLYRPAYERVLKMSHSFNLLDARGAVGTEERQRLIGRVRGCARKVASLYVSAWDTVSAGSRP